MINVIPSRYYTAYIKESVQSNCVEGQTNPLEDLAIQMRSSNELYVQYLGAHVIASVVGSHHCLADQNSICFQLGDLCFLNEQKKCPLVYKIPFALSDL